MRLFEDNQAQELKDFENFKKLEALIQDLNETTSTNDKIEKLAQYKDNEFIRKIFYYTYTDFKQYHVKPSNLKKRSDLMISTFSFKDLFELLEELNEGNISGHNAIAEVNCYINMYSQFKDIIYKIFDRNLETRMSVKLINKAIPGLIPTFEVALAQKYDSKMKKKVDFQNQEWLVSRKLDGVRLITMIDEEGYISFYSRDGKPFKTLDVLRHDINKLRLRNTVLDGEVCIVDEQGNEDFQTIIRQIKRKNYTIENPKYILFDMLSMAEFMNKEGTVNFKQRYENLKETIPENSKNLEVAYQEIVQDEDHIARKTQEAIDNGWEGVMLRRNVPYEGKRTKNLLKVKQFLDTEYTVEDVEFGPYRVVEGGKERTENILTNIYIKHRGNLVSVGSGFSIADRRYYKEHPEEIIGKEVTIQYFNESKNDKGEYSLRFPTVKAIYQGKRDV